MKAFEVKRRSEQGPFGKDVVVAPKQEPSGAVTFFEETEDRFDKGFATPIMDLAQSVAIRLLWRCRSGSLTLTLIERPWLLLVHSPNAGQARQTSPRAL